MPNERTTITRNKIMRIIIIAHYSGIPQLRVTCSIKQENMSVHDGM